MAKRKINVNIIGLTFAFFNGYYRELSKFPWTLEREFYYNMIIIENLIVMFIQSCHFGENSFYSSKCIDLNTLKEKMKHKIMSH